MQIEIACNVQIHQVNHSIGFTRRDHLRESHSMLLVDLWIPIKNQGIFIQSRPKLDKQPRTPQK